MHRGLTVIEPLVVVAIVSILALIMVTTAQGLLSGIFTFLLMHTKITKTQNQDWLN